MSVTTMEGELLGFAHEFAAVGGLAHDFDVFLAFEQRLQTGSDNVVIVGNENSDFHAVTSLGVLWTPGFRNASGCRVHGDDRN